VNINTYLGVGSIVTKPTKRIPTILTADELLDKAFRRVLKIRKEGDDRMDGKKKTTVARLTASGDIISTTLILYVRAFPSMQKREEFHMELLDLLVGLDQLKKSLSALSWCSQQVMKLRKEYIRRAKNAQRASDLERVRKEYYGRASSMINQIAGDLEIVSKGREAFKKLPAIDASVPTVVIAGFPNVGKSQLVDRISTAKPTIAAYPFTTKGITIGHFQEGWRRYQVVDTPGLLDRELSERNNIERQAILALKYLADVIVFILDPSETSGYTMEKQLRLLAEVKREFAIIPVIEVENKIDVMDSGSSRLKMSALNGTGIEKLQGIITEHLKNSAKAKITDENFTIKKESDQEGE
jgi:nucleolar GTP-binding protein